MLIGWRGIPVSKFDRFAPLLEGKKVILDPGYGHGGRPEEYLAFARGYQGLFGGCLAWDAPGAGAVENTHWFLWCGSAGLPNMVPVFHPGMPWRFLGAMQAMCGRVALGGLLRFSVKQRIAYLDEVFYLPDGSLRNPGLRVHGLGMDNHEVITRYPWESVDSQSWNRPIRFGEGGTVHEAIQRQGGKGQHPWHPACRPRFLIDTAHELGYGLRTMHPNEIGGEKQ